MTEVCYSPGYNRGPDRTGGEPSTYECEKSPHPTDVPHEWDEIAPGQFAVQWPVGFAAGPKTEGVADALKSIHDQIMTLADRVGLDGIRKGSGTSSLDAVLWDVERAVAQALTTDNEEYTAFMKRAGR